MQITEAEIADVIAHETNIDRALLTRDADLAELDIQSLEIVEIIFALEDKFGIEIPYNANSGPNDSTGISIQTIGDLLDLITAISNEQPKKAAVR
ncbi:MAG: phosphopantetheine-binding protein [Parvibaculaceae bacterium]